MTYFLHKIQVGEGGKRFAKVLDTARDWTTKNSAQLQAASEREDHGNRIPRDVM